MNKFMRFGAILALALSAVACSKVEPGYVGIRVSNFGERGVQGEVVLPGKYVYNGPGYQMYPYPVFKQTTTWTKADGKQLTFSTGDGMSVGAEVGMTWAVGATCVSKFFSEFRVQAEQVTDGFVRNNVRSAFNDYASSMKVEHVYGAGKVELLNKVRERVQKDLAPKCLIVDDVFLVSDFELPPNVRTAINNKIQATQEAERAQNEVAKATAEAQKEVATAKGTAESKLIAARSEAEAIQIKGDALRGNPGLIELERVKAMQIAASRWQGQGDIVPKTVMGDSAGKGLIFQLPAQQ